MSYVLIKQANDSRMLMETKPLTNNGYALLAQVTYSLSPRRIVAISRSSKGVKFLIFSNHRTRTGTAKSFLARSSKVLGMVFGGPLFL